jgi:hypothetical protein
VDNSSLVSADNMSVSINQDSINLTQKNNSFTGSSLQLGEHVLTIAINKENVSSESEMVEKNIFVFPSDLSFYTIEITDTDPLTLQDTSAELGWLSGIVLILSSISFIGAITSWKRKYSDVTLIACLVGIFSIGIYFSGIILGIIAFWLILRSQDEFDDGKKGKSF